MFQFPSKEMQQLVVEDSLFALQKAVCGGCRELRASLLNFWRQVAKLRDHLACG